MFVFDEGDDAGEDDCLKKALLRAGGHDGRTGIASLQQGLAAVDEQTTFLFPLAYGVAFIAVLNEDGANFGFKEAKLLRAGLRSSSRVQTGKAEDETGKKNLGRSHWLVESGTEDRTLRLRKSCRDKGEAGFDGWFEPTSEGRERLTPVDRGSCQLTRA